MSCYVYKQLNSETSELWELEKSTWPNHEASRFVEADATRWHVQRMGAGPPLLLIHGTGASTHSWRDVMPILARHYSVIAIDLPGHGFTDSSSAVQSSIAGMSASLASVLRALEVEPRYCVGHSAGAVVLCRMALDGFITPRTIASINGAFLPLGGVASRFFSPVARLLASNSLVARFVARRAQTHATVARLIASTGSTLDAAGIDLYARLVRNPRHVAGALRMMGNWDLYEFERALPRLSIPMTLLVGDNDLMVPPQQAFTVQEQLSRAAVQRLAGLGHLAHEEQPELIAQQLTAICGSYS